MTNMREYFTDEELQAYTRILMMKDMVGEVVLSTNPCPLLLRQVSELKALLNFLAREVKVLEESLQVS
jgi:hypothetical protein